MIRATPKKSRSRSTIAADSSSHSQIGNALSCQRPVSAGGSGLLLALQRRLALFHEALGLLEVALVRHLGVLAEKADMVVGDGDEAAVDRRDPVAVVDRAYV